MFGLYNTLNHVPEYKSSQKKLVAKILQVGAGGVIAGFSTICRAVYIFYIRFVYRINLSECCATRITLDAVFSTFKA